MMFFDKSSVISLPLTILLLTGCGYSLITPDTPCYRSIYVPYAVGDRDGGLTNAVIQKLSSSGAYEYRACGADLTLYITLIDFREENIGFRYDRTQDGFLTNSVIPTELRYAVLAEIVVVETATGREVIGPARISTHVDLDHDYYASRNAVNVFSLGQLTDIDSARDTMHEPLNLILAQKIVDYVTSSW